MISQIVCVLVRWTPPLHQWTPEEFRRAGLVFAREEVDAGGDELVEAEVVVVVRVDCPEGLDGQLRIEAEDLKEERVLVLLDLTVAVGVDGAEEEWQRSGERVLQRRVLDLLSQRIDEGRLIDGRSVADTLEVLLPNLATSSIIIVIIIIIIRKY